MAPYSHPSSMKAENGSVYNRPAADETSQSASIAPTDTIQTRSSAGRAAHAPSARRHHAHGRPLDRQVDPILRNHRQTSHTHRHQPNQILQSRPLQPLPRSYPGQDSYFPHPPADFPAAYPDQVVLDEVPAEESAATPIAVVLPLPINGAYVAAYPFPPTQMMQNGVIGDHATSSTTLSWYIGHTPEERMRLGLPRWITPEQQGAYEQAAAVYQYVDRNF